MDIIKIENLDFSYSVYNSNTNEREKLKILKNINLTIKQGEILAILGHNGSGKSTLAKLINGLLFPESGDITVFGLNTKDEQNVWDIRQNVGMVFQNPDNQIIASIVEEDIAFGPENLGIDPKIIKQRVDESLKNVGMEGFNLKTPSLLSGGQKQRIAIAGVIAMKPKCIIFDESTSMLDPRGRKEVMDTSIKLNKQDGITVVLITHFMEEAVLADRVVVLNEGEISMIGTPNEVFSNVNELKKLSLDVPQMTELCYNLRNHGFNIKNILTIEEMVEELCNYN